MGWRPLKVFLCHSSEDKADVRKLYHRLRTAAGSIAPWLDEESLLPGQKWEDEIPIAVRNSDIVLACLSKASTQKTGYVQKEIKCALDVADMQPEGTIYIIPVKLEECQLPQRLKHLHCVNLFEEGGFVKLMRSLTTRAEKLGIYHPQGRSYSPEQREVIIRRVIAEELGVDESELTPEATLEDLAGDGFDAIDIKMRLEDQFGIILSDEDLGGIQIVKDVIEGRDMIGG